MSKFINGHVILRTFVQLEQGTKVVKLANIPCIYEDRYEVMEQFLQRNPTFDKRECHAEFVMREFM